MEFVLIGKIINTFGIKGELKVASYTDFEKERFAKDSTVYIGEEHLPFRVGSLRSHKGFLLLQLKDNEDINLVEKYKNRLIYKDKEDIPPLPQGEYYFSDIRGLEVYVEGIRVGKVIEMEEGTVHNNMRIRKEEDGKEYLVPFLPVFVENVDLENGKIDIIRMEGLL
ncbi:MAG: 16S rRNA processing protein RimM [Erysipelotrichaceae bacterium]|nr:16S rRNA processing protein RimM [Erysipelotrichaceae bacterium]MBQ2582648.1 16S rRNA processing protein RimM [Erysipelotrichaceae bacterium]